MPLTLKEVALGIGICGSLAYPLIWGGQVNSVNAVQGVRIDKNEATIEKLDVKLQTLDNKMNALLVQSGIDPQKIK